MADRDDAILAIKSYGALYQPKFRHWLAYMGDGNGNVNTSQANYNLVRYPLSSSPAVEVFNVRAPTIDNLRVIVGYTAQQPNLLQVIDVADARLDLSSGDETVIIQPTYTLLPNHAANHQYLGIDPVLINWRQITPLGVFPTYPASMSVQIRAGYIPRVGPDIFVSDQVIDLTSHQPVSGARYVLISYDATGSVVVTDGTVKGDFSSLTFADIPDTPPACWRTCAVVLYAGQTAIVETRVEIDLLDLRFPEEVRSSGSDIPAPVTSTLYFNPITPSAFPSTPAYRLGLAPTPGADIGIANAGNIPVLLASFVSDNPVIGAIEAGFIEAIINAYHTNTGGKYAGLFYKLYTVISDGAGGYSLDTLILTSNTHVITSNSAAIVDAIDSVSRTVLGSNRYLLVQWWADFNGSSGTDATHIVTMGAGVERITFPSGSSSSILSLTSGHIFVGDASNIAKDVALSGDAALANTGALTLANSGVTPATYGDATHVSQVAIDAKGRITGASNVAITAGHTIQDEGTPLTAQPNLNFTGTAVVATNDSSNSASKVTINYWSPLTNPEVPDLVFDSNGDVIMIEVTL